MRKMYVYSLDAKSGFTLSHVSLEYANEGDCFGCEKYNLKIVSGDKHAFVEICPEELAELYNGFLGDYLKHRIRCTMSEMP